MKYHFTPNRMAIISFKNVDNYVEKWKSLCVALGNAKCCSH